MAKTKTVNRSSETGKFVTERFTKTHPKTTETQRVRTSGNSGGGKKSGK